MSIRFLAGNASTSKLKDFFKTENSENQNFRKIKL